MLVDTVTKYLHDCVLGRCGKVFSAWYSLSTALVPGWPGPHHSADFCEGLEDSSGGQDVFHLSDMEEEVLVQLVRRSFTFQQTSTLTKSSSYICYLFCIKVIKVRMFLHNTSPIEL